MNKKIIKALTQVVVAAVFFTAGRYIFPDIRKKEAEPEYEENMQNIYIYMNAGKGDITATNDVPDGALKENEDGSINAYDKDGKKVGTVSAEEAEEAATLNGFAD